LYPSEKKSLYRFLAIYLLSTFILFLLGAGMFYMLEKNSLLNIQKESMKQEGERIHHQLVQLQRRFDPVLPISLDPDYQLLLLDKERDTITKSAPFPQNLQFQHTYQLIDTQMIYIKPVDPYYLGAAYILLSKPIDTDAVKELQKYIILFMLGAGGFFLGLGYFLGRLFIAPMRESIERMNRFIQDTTHELNTPVSTILTNLELIETLHKCDAKVEMQRIEIASKTLSRIYDDLTYLKLNQSYHREIEPINISNLLQERVLYFSAALEAKRITLETDIQPGIIIEMDQEDAFRLLDNLISNAIKYNKMNGHLKITLSNDILRLRDSGVGITKKDLITIHERFRRANQSEGGFGIGLDIVYQIIDIYHFDITIDSIPDKGTEVSIQWHA
jgi:two-component system OmpR family sensor kinase